MRFSSVEIKDLFIAWILVSIAFGIALRQTTSLVTNIWISLITVGVAFIVHELAHKFVAQWHGKYAEFRANLPMLIVAVVLSFTGFVLAAPGAVIISGFVNRRENGIIGAAGPVSNIILALILLPFVFLIEAGTLMHLIFSFGFLINAWLALFNMIPFWVFDGAKIITWNKFVYGVIVAAAFILVFVGSFLTTFF